MAKRQDASTGEIVDDDVSAGSIEDKAAADAKAAEVLRVKVWSPFKVFYDGEAASVSAESGTGPFDILPHHHNFITLLTACELSIQAKRRGKINIKISDGIMHVHENAVTVFLEV